MAQPIGQPASQTTNPWLDLGPAAPFVHRADRALVEAFNRDAAPEHRFDLSLLPEPFIGSPDAPVVMLGLNPGWDPRDAAVHQDARFASAVRDNLVHRSREVPFYLLDPALRSPGVEWWTQRLGYLIRATSLKAVASSVFCIELVAYHSRSFSQRVPSLPSQAYGFALVRAAIRRNALVLVMRSQRAWYRSVPELAGCRRLLRLNSAQNPTVSPKNCPTGFEAIVRAIRERAGVS